MNEKECLRWISVNLGEAIRKAMQDSKAKNQALLYTFDWLVAMAYRETGIKIIKLIKKGFNTQDIIQNMKGDWSQRPGEKEPQYHGFGFWQIDIASYPEFVKSGDWKDPYKCCMKAISVLEEKRIYLQKHFPNLADESLHRAITAAYNCGQGNVAKVLRAGQDVDRRTHGQDYSKEVWRFRKLYKEI